jgi:polyketide synthase PksN
MDYEQILRALQEKKINPADAKKELTVQNTVPEQSSVLHSSGISNTQTLQSPSQKQPQLVINEDTAKETVNLSSERINAHKKIANPIPQIHSEASDCRESIAIVGMSGRYPDSNNLSQYWDNLLNARNSIKEIPKSRWDVSQYYDPRPYQKGKVYCKWLGMLDDIEYFDPLFFNISPAEAEGMDPQHRLFLQEGYKAFEDAGFNCQSLSNKNCGVYLGIMNSEYGVMMLRSQAVENVGSTDHNYAIGAARIPYFLNLKGPAIPIDTACSSSLVATHLACQALLTNEIDMALVGGVTLYLIPESYIGMCAAGMLSPEGQCKTFDNGANGFVPGEGVGTLVLKRLKDAEADRDHIYGVIIGSGINQDGKTNGITAPSAKSQMELVRSIYDKHKINPESISYVEMHGTGTKLGDPIELDALSTVFKEKTNKKNYCAIGSVKSNIGHTSAAAGVASIQKVLSCLQHKKLVPTLNFKVPNEHFNFKESPFFVNTESRSWEVAAGIPRRACVSAFGFSGTNAHVVIEEYLPQNAVSTPISINTNNPIIFVLSAKSKEQLRVYAECLKNWIASHEDLNLADMAYTLQVGREPMDYRLAFLADSQEVLLKAITGFIDNKPLAGVLTDQVKRGKDEVAVFEKDEDAVSLLQTWFLKRRFKKIAELWVKGLNIDWNQFYGDAKPCRISLPTYPFARERYWAAKGDDSQPASNTVITGASAASIHPLLQQNTSDFTAQRFSSTFTGQEFFLMGHVVQGQRILPGVAYLEMVRAAVEQATGALTEGHTGIQLKNVVWARPIVVGDQPVKIHIGLFPEDNGQITYEIYSEPVDDDADPVMHSQGSALLCAVAEVPALDLKTLQAKCSQSSFSPATCYETFKAMGIDYGPGHQGIEMVYAGSGQVLAKLSLPTSVADTKDQFILHPSLLDSALQASIGFGLFAEGASSTTSLKPSVPFALAELTIIEKCTRNMWALIKYGDGSAPGDKVQKLDIDLCDEHGTVCVRLKGYSTRVMEDETGSLAVLEKLETLMLEPVWQEQAASQEEIAPDYIRHVVILCEQSEISRESVEICMDGVSCLTLALEQQDIAERFSAYAVNVFEKIQNILNEKPKGKVLIQIVIPNQNEAQLCCGLAGMLKTARLENPQIIGQIIEVGSGENVESITEKLQENSRYPLVNRIYYQDGKRLIGGWGEVAASSEAVKIPWKDRGVYLVTGGAGGLGLIFAQEIAYKVKDATLILTGRSSLNEDKKAKLKELESLGARIVYKQVDVTQKKAVDELIQRIQADFGGINGIIHSAGVIKDNFIIKKTKDEFLEVLAPKVTGLVYLDQASKEQPLDFFILFSSAAGVVGSLGQADYAAANAFMNGYAKYRSALVVREQRYGQTLSISWPLWQEGGMSIDVESEKMMRQNTGMVAMQTSTGIQALYQGLALSQDQVMVMEGERKRLQAALLKQQTGTEFLKVSYTIDENKVVSAIDQDSLQEKAANYFKKLLSSVIKLPAHRIEVDAPMEQYGIDSIMVTQMTNQLEKSFGSLSKTLFFEYQTIKDLTGYFLENYREQLAELLGLEKKTAVSTGRPQDFAVVAETEKTTVGSRRHHPRFVSVRMEDRVEEKALDIAIIGVSGRYPQARDIQEFWKNLRDGKDCITEVPRERWEHSLYFDENKNKRGKTYSKWGGFLDGVDQFDPLFFNISPREAAFMDPQERLFLECVYETLEDAGYTREALGLHQSFGLGGNVGVYVGVMYEEYQLYGAQEQIQGRPIALGGNPATIANRVSYFCNFHGPSMAVDTMCSSSLTSIHLACHSLQRGECKLAIAGGVNVSVHPNKYLLLGQGKFVSSKGRCESFGQGGDGYVPGEGVGAVLLKPLDKAVADGDHIYGIIKATAINHGGKTNGYTVPNPNAQAEVIEKAFMQAGIDVRALSYLEAHGTGTSLGDPIEITGLTKAFQKHTKDKQFCAIGSAKSNIGHCESAAGIAGVTKILLQLKYRQLVPSLHSQILNPNIDFANTPFVVQQELAEWKRPVIEQGGEAKEYPRIAGISSFGAGGSNAHVVIEEYIPQVAERLQITITPQNPAVIVLSAKNEERLQEQAQQLLNVINEQQFFNVNLADVAYTLQVGREAMEERLAVVVGSIEELEEKLNNFVKGQDDIENFYRGQVKRNKEMLAFFAEDEDMTKTIDAWIAKGKYAKLLDLWVKGLAFDWSKLYGDNKPHRTNLPTYPFCRDRYWFPKFEMQSISGTEGASTVENTSSIALPILQQSLEPSIIQEPAISNMSKPDGISLRSLSDNPMLETKPASQTLQSIKLMPTGMPSLPVSNISQTINEIKPRIHVQTAGSVEALQEELATSLAEALYMKRSDMDIDSKFIDLGMDSIIGVEWVQTINNRYRTSIAATKVYDYPTISELAGYLEEELVKQGDKIVSNSMASAPIILASESVDTQTQVNSRQSLEALQEELAASLTEALYMKRSDMDIDTKFIDLGMDSIIGVEWIQTINNRYRTSIAATKVYDYPTISEFAGFMEKELSKLTPSLSLQEVLQQLNKGTLDMDQANQLINQYL